VIEGFKISKKFQEMGGLSQNPEELEATKNILKNISLHLGEHEK